MWLALISVSHDLQKPAIDLLHSPILSFVQVEPQPPPRVYLVREKITAMIRGVPSIQVSSIGKLHESGDRSTNTSSRDQQVHNWG